MYPNYKVNRDAGTVTHISGMVFKFIEDRDGGWIGYPSDDTIKFAGGKSPEEIAGIARLAGDAWQHALKKDD